MIRNILLVALGGAIGSVCRYLLSGMSDASWPWGTFTVNILGSLLIGLLVGLVSKGIVSPEMKLLLVYRHKRRDYSNDKLKWQYR